MKRLHEKKIDDAKYYERIWSEKYNARPFYDTVRMQALVAPVAAGNRVLDVGAGVFGAVQFLAEHSELAGLDLVAVDQSYTAQEIVLRDFPQINYLLADVEALPFSDDSFDVVIAGEIVEHMEDPKILAKELMRVVKPGGTMVLSTVDTTCDDAIAHGEYPEHLWEFTPEDLLDLFPVHTVRGYYLIGDYHFVQVLK